MFGQTPPRFAASDPKAFETSRPLAASADENGSLASSQTSGPRREIGPIVTGARLVAGFLLVGNVVYGQLVTHHVGPAS